MARLKKDGNFVNCKVRQDVFDHLQSYSVRSMIPKTSIVEKAIEEYLNKVDPIVDVKNEK